MAEKVADVVKTLKKMGIMVTATQSIEADTAIIIATEFGHTISWRSRHFHTATN